MSVGIGLFGAMVGGGARPLVEDAFAVWTRTVLTPGEAPVSAQDVG